MDSVQARSANTQTTQPTEMVGLAAVRNIIQALDEHGIGYCHWKSNLRLEAALNGQTDLDLLVDKKDEPLFRHILRETDIKRVMAPPGKQYPGLEDYIGYDPASGSQFHLHVHYQLVLGEQFVKNYHLPLEKPFFNSVIRHHGVNVPSPEMELIVLSMRALLKYRDRDAIKDIFSIRYPGIPEHIAKEIDWLLAKTSMEQISVTLIKLGDLVPKSVVLTFLQTITAEPRDGRTLLKLRQQLRRSLSGRQRYRRPWATLIYFRELWKRRNNFLRFASQPQATLPNGGLTLALVGVDGAGKTTLTQAVTAWLGWKLDVHTYYLGSKQPSRASEWSYLLFRMARRSHRELSNHIGKNNVVLRLIESVRDTLLYSHYLFTGVDRYRRYRAGIRKAKAGSIVIYDRYPLEAPLDGPQIHLAPNGNTARSAAILARIEQRLYQKMALPDLLFVLEVDPAISLERKPDHDRDTIVQKHAVLERLAADMEHNGITLYRINAGRPLKKVLGHIKQIIWQQLGINYVDDH